ncbi:TonB-dependent receptor [Sphingomonas sp.]
MRSLLLAAAAFAPVSAIAQQAPAGPDIVVTGRGLPSPERRSDNVVVIDRERLTAAASNRLEDVLGDVAGLQSFRRADSRSANPTSQGITLRGIGGNASSRALLILDGVPQADPFGGWVAFPGYATARLGGVRVQRGGGSAIWGSGALAGVIELSSATPDQLAAVTLDLFYGERNAVDAQASTSLVREAGFATVNIGYARGDGFVPVVAEDRGSIDRRAPFEQANVSVRGVVAIAADTELQATVQAFVDRRERGLAFSEIESDGADASLRLVGSGTWAWSALGYVQTRQFASRFAAIDAARATVTPTLDQYAVPGTGLGARFELAPPLGEAATLLIGADTRATSGRTQELFSYVAGAPTRIRQAGGDTQTAGLFADASLTAGALRIDANGRYDRWWIRNGNLTENAIGTGTRITDTAYADRSGGEWTGRIGVAYTPVGPLTLRAAGYRAWRLPTPNELYRPFRAGADATAANADLAPERLSGIEAGFDLRLDDRFTLAATWFDNRLEDAIANVTVARGPGTFPGVGFVSAAGFYRQRRNLDAIDARGLELDAQARLGRFRAILSYAYADARVDGDGLAAPLNGLRPAQVPEHQASATLGWSAARARLATTLRYVSSQFEDDANARALGDAFTVDTVASAPLTRAVSIELRGENLFDARVETGFSGPAIERARPRQLWIGLRGRFD